MLGYVWPGFVTIGKFRQSYARLCQVCSQ